MRNYYQTFLPNYYGSLVKGQQNALLLDNLYFYVANGTDKTAVANTDHKSIYDEQQVLSEVLYGGKMQPQNLVAMIRKVDWTSGKVFAKYDSRDPYLNEKDFYCKNSSNAVYKCLDNNNNSPSTEQPNTLVPGPFKLSDGYIWQYMYQLTDDQINQYSIGDYIPLVVDPNVTAAAIRGTISTVDVIDGGKYSATTSGTIQEVVSPNLLKLETTASTVNGAYDGMALYISGGLGEGKISQISSYVANTSGRFAELTTPITGIVAGSEYDIAPYIQIQGNGIYASARAVMVGERISHVEILNRGMEYTRAQATISANPSYVDAPATLEVNISPIKGHGGDIYQELYVDNVLFTLNMDNFTIEDVDFPINDITFSKVGMLRQVIDNSTPTLYTAPTFNNTFTMQTSPLFGNYAVGDKVHRPVPVPMPVSATVVYANTTHIVGTYDSPIMRFNVSETIINQNGITSVAVDIKQPQVRLLGTDIVALINVDTIKRGENQREYLQILIKVK